MKRNARVVVAIASALLAIVAVHLYFPTKVQLGNRNVSARDEKIIIVPMAGIPLRFLQSVRDTLQEQHKTRILVTTEMGKGNEMKLESGQYNANVLASVGDTVRKRIGLQKAFLLVVTNEDINYPESGLRYLYSVHYEGISVVSFARINPLNFGVDMNLISIPSKFIKMKERALKLLNKSIGYGLYGYEASSDIKSVMYGPIMGPDDLDNVGSWY